MPLINFSGIASGIDSAALITATSDATRARDVTPSQNRITALEDTNKAFADLKSKLSALQTVFKDFASTAGGPLTKKAVSNDDNELTATASNSASNGTYTVTSHALATSSTWTIGNSGKYASSTAVIDSTLTESKNMHVVIGSPLKQEFDIAVSNTTTLSDFVTSFNNQTTRAVATIVNVGTSTPDYRISIKTYDTGVESGTLTLSGTDLLGTGKGFDVETHVAAANANFDVDGVATGIERSTNTISDLIPGLTLNLVAANATPTNIVVSDDSTATTSKIQQFVTAYNEIVALIQKNNKIERKESGTSVTNIFGPLSQTTVDDNSLTALRTAMTSSSYASGSEIRVLADLGITTDSGAYDETANTGGGTLKFDSTVFASALSKEPNSVNEILKKLGDTAGLTGGTIDHYIRFSGLIDSAVTGNKTLITDLNDRIATAETRILKQEETMRAQFARLEATIGKLQSQASSLTSALSGLNAK
jgi:flagellar hook-associated protein 2